ncbi:MAG TPA: hypothetical protein VFF73_15875 [Planctomycetota bacterium]|nr:hypothetical protein [Planctomycetota bacterium]
MAAERDDTWKEILRLRWSYGDFVDQLRTMRKLGPLNEVLPRVAPRLGELAKDVENVDLDHFQRILEAMTSDEREIDELLDPKRGPERVNRIAARANLQPDEVSHFFGRFHAMRRLLQQFGRDERGWSA